MSPSTPMVFLWKPSNRRKGMCLHPGASPTFGGWRTMEAETRHLPEYRCLAPSLQPVTELHWLCSPRCGFEQRFLHGDGPAQVGLGSFEPHRLYIKTERSVPATHANVQRRIMNYVYLKRLSRANLPFEIRYSCPRPELMSKAGTESVAGCGSLV